jgi:hypothetical protein
LDKALASILGAAVGNMIGSELSGMDLINIDENIVDRAMNSNGPLDFQF